MTQFFSIVDLYENKKNMPFLKFSRSDVTTKEFQYFKRNVQKNKAKNSQWLAFFSFQFLNIFQSRNAITPCSNREMQSVVRVDVNTIVLEMSVCRNLCSLHTDWCLFCRSQKSPWV